MNAIRVVFMGTPEFAVPALQSIHQDPQFQIVGVYTQPDRPVGRGLELRASPVKREALQFGLPVVQPERLSAPGEFEKLAALAPDVLVVVAFGQILRRNVLDLPKWGCVNIHSSLLPRWRGAAPIVWAIWSGDQETGVTTMKMVEELDAGDILLQESTPIGEEDHAGSLHDRLAEMGGRLILPTLKELVAGKLTGQAQDTSQVTYAKKLTKEMQWLDFHEPAEVLGRKVRALNPWPGTSISVLGQRLKIKSVQVRPDLTGHEGQIYERSGMLLMGTSSGALELQRFQWEGKKEIGTSEFLNGLRGRGVVFPLPIDPSKAS